MGSKVPFQCIYIHSGVTSVSVTSNMVHWPLLKPSRSSGRCPPIDSGSLLSLPPAELCLFILSLSPSSQPLTARFLSFAAKRPTGAGILGKSLWACQITRDTRGHHVSSQSLPVDQGSSGGQGSEMWVRDGDTAG